MPPSSIDIEQQNLPLAIKALRYRLTPQRKEEKTPKELNSDLVKIEERLNLDLVARKRLRRLLFPSINELQNISDLPTPSPPKIEINDPAKLTTAKEQKTVRVKESLQTIACSGMTKRYIGFFIIFNFNISLKL